MARPRKQVDEFSASIYHGADGRWHAKITMGTRLNGRVDRKHLSRGTKSEVEKAVRALERGRDSGQYRWTAADPTLGTWIDHWLASIVPMTTRWKTRSTYRSQLTRHVLPSLGHVRLSALQPEQLESLYVDLLRDGSSAITIGAVHRVLRSCLNEAVRRRRLVHNPALVARPPRVPATEVHPLSVEECQRILRSASSSRNAARWSIGLSLGLRQGEVLGLSWSDIDLDGGFLRVRCSVQRWTWEHGCDRPGFSGPSCGRRRGADCPHRHGGGLRLVEPKTKASHRTIALPRQLIEELRSHRAAQNHERLAAGATRAGEHHLVFTTPAGEIIDPARDHQQWRTLLKASEVRRVRVHDMRHTAATLLLLQGVDVRTLMAIMGWTEMATAQRYTHVIDELRRRAANQIGALLWASSADHPQTGATLEQRAPSFPGRTRDGP